MNEEGKTIYRYVNDGDVIGNVEKDTEGNKNATFGNSSYTGTISSYSEGEPTFNRNFIRIKTEDTVDVNKLVKYKDVLYGKSYAIIDFAQKPEGNIGIIDKLIDNEYIPKYNGETNAEEILNAKVVSIRESTMVLYYDNNYVLFEKMHNQ